MGHFVAFHFSYQNVVVKSSLVYKMIYFCVKTLKTFVEGNLFRFLFVYLYLEVTKRVYFIGNERMLIAHDSNRLRFS